MFPNWTRVYGPFFRVANKISAFPPLNITYLAAIAEQAGHKVQIVDAEIEGLTDQDTVNRVKNFSPDLVGITSTTPVFHIVKGLAQIFKEQVDIPIMVGGPHVTLFKEKVFEKYFDFIFVSESESSFARFLECYESKGNLSEIPGLILRVNGNTIFTGEPQKETNLDKIPFPARHLLKYKHYKRETPRGILNYTTILTKRGCPYQCIYCCNVVYGKLVRKRSMDNVMAEIESVIEKFGIRHFYFADDVMTLDRKHTLSLCDEIDKRGTKITFEGATRADLVDEELIARLANSGMIRINFGLESADPEVLKIVKKEVPLECYVKANRFSNKYGIETFNNVMLGLPGETRESIEKTVSFLRNARDIQHVMYSIATPYPGTEFYEMAKKGEYGLKLHTEDFSKYQRHNSAVLTVNDMSPEEIIRLQKIGLFKIYLVPWRLRPLLKRFGFFALIFTTLSLLVEQFRGNRSKNKTLLAR